MGIHGGTVLAIPAHLKPYSDIQSPLNQLQYRPNKKEMRSMNETSYLHRRGGANKSTNLH